MVESCGPECGGSAWQRGELIILLIVVLAYGLSAYQRNFVWKDQITFWSDVIGKSPNKGRGYDNLGIAYHKAGNLERAIMVFNKGLSAAPDNEGIHTNIGFAYYENGILRNDRESVREAIRHFKRALEINPWNGEAHYDLGLAYAGIGLYGQAYEEMNKGEELRIRETSKR